MTLEIVTESLSERDIAALRIAVRALEGESFASRLANLVGRQVQAAGRALPSAARKIIASATETALKAALRVAIRTIDNKAPAKPQAGFHKALAAASGAAGGALAWPRLRWNCPSQRRSCCDRSLRSPAPKARI
jgi:hypothetical protein